MSTSAPKLLNDASDSSGPRGVAGGTRLALLDGFELRHEGSLIRLPLSAQSLLAFLALHDRQRQRLYVAGSLWQERTVRSVANLTRDDAREHVGSNA